MGNCIIRRRYIESSPTPPIPTTTLVVGNTYSFGGYDWVCTESFNDYAVLRSEGVTGGNWPGYVMTGPTTGSGNWGSANSNYEGNIDGTDISGYDDAMSTLYAAIGSTEYTSASYGKGLYLPSQSEILNNFYSNSALKKAASNHADYGATGTYGGGTAWTGTYYSSGYVYAISSLGLDTFMQGSPYSGTCVIAPGFNVDLSKINVSSENVITVK